MRRFQLRKCLAPAMILGLAATGLAATPFDGGRAAALQAYAGPTGAPVLQAPADPTGAKIYRKAVNTRGAKILVSVDQRWLWYIKGRDTLMSSPVAVGMESDFSFDGRDFQFETPRSIRKVLRKQENPVWVPPVWHYYEKAIEQGLEPVELKEGEAVELSDGTFLEVRDGVVGRINQYGNWYPWSQGMEIILDGKIFIPPLNSPQRQVSNALGPRKLDMGDGYMIHGTHIYNEDSIGQAVSHGCVRMRNEDVTILYDIVPVGTPVFIF